MIALVVARILSEININASIYKSADNSVEIIFPQWNVDKPWFYVYWTPGTLRLTPPEKEEPAPEDRI